MVIKRTLHLVLFCIIIMLCSNNKTSAQPSYASSNETLIQNVNKTKSDAKGINLQLKKLQLQNDFIIAFATLNYAWLRKATYYVLANKNNEWKLYIYQSTLTLLPVDTTTEIISVSISSDSAEAIKKLYASSQLLKTNGDENRMFCGNKKNCNITDAETWTLSIATPKNIHTTTYYAPEFFEKCCPGNLYRQQFIAIAKEIKNLADNKDSM